MIRIVSVPERALYLERMVRHDVFGCSARPNLQIVCSLIEFFDPDDSTGRIFFSDDDRALVLCLLQCYQLMYAGE